MLPSRIWLMHDSLPCKCRNVPYANQSTAVGIVTAASYAGTALAFGISPYIITNYGWQVHAKLSVFCFCVFAKDETSCTHHLLFADNFLQLCSHGSAVAASVAARSSQASAQRPPASTGT